MRVTLDLDPEADDRDVAAELRALGWRREAPDRQKFGHGYGATVVVYFHDLCGDCQGDEPRPHPRFGSGRVCQAATVGAFANDPCDEWPRTAIFVAAGLRPDCGHPKGDKFGSCAHCAAGHPIGHTTSWWRR